MYASRRDSEYLGYAGGIDIVYVEQFSRHVAGVDNLGFTGFRQNRIFWHIKLLGNEFKDMFGKFSNLRHSVGICLKFYFGREQNGTPRV